MTKRSHWARHRKLAVITCTGVLVSGLILPVLATTAAAATAGRLGPPNTFVATAPLGVAQSEQTATLLSDGRVLIAAGGTTNAELYNPATRSFAPTAKMPLAVSGATATLLRSGKVLVAGGVHGLHQVASAELLMSVHPASGKAGSKVTVTGSGFYAGETVTLLWDSITVVGHAKATATGSFGTTITIPKATAGAHVIAVRGRRSFAGTAATFTVTSAR